MPSNNIIDQIKTRFVPSYSPTTSWGNVISNYLSLPRLRAFWPISSSDYGHNLYDISGQGRTLTRGHVIDTNDIRSNEFVTFTDTVRASSQRWSRADEPDLDIMANTAFDTGLTLGAWVLFGTPSMGSATGILTKWTTSGDQRAYRLIKSSSDYAALSVSSDGTAGGVANAINTAVTLDSWEWYFIVGTMTPSQNMSCWVNLNKYTTTTSIPDKIADTTAIFYLARNDTADYLDGQIALPFVCAAPLADTMVRSLYHQTRALFGK